MLQSPKYHHENKKTFHRASKYSLYLPLISAEIHYSKRFGIEIKTKNQKILLDGQSIYTKPHATAIISVNDIKYLVFFHDEKLYSFDLKHQDDITRLLSSLSESNPNLYEKIFDNIQRVMFILSFQQKSDLPQMSSFSTEELIQKDLHRQYMHLYQRKANKLQTLETFKQYKNNNLISIGTGQQNDIVIETACPEDFEIFLYTNQNKRYLLSKKDYDWCQLYHHDSHATQKILRGSILIPLECSLSISDELVLKLSGQSMLAGDRMYDLNILSSARDEFLAHC
ncbi:MAG: hypothetical protein WCO78_05120 [Candidatus Roizmanbacteria bacterium]